MRTGTLLLLVFVAATALGELLWWRFRGNGRLVAAPTAPVVTRNHHSLPLFHYERAGATPAPPVAAAPPAPSRALASLLPEEDFRAQEAAELQGEADRAEAAQAENRQQTIEETPSKEPAPDEKPAAEAEAPRLVSSRHAAGAVASLLDALDEAPAADPTPPPRHQPLRLRPRPTRSRLLRRSTTIRLRPRPPPPTTRPTGPLKSPCASSAAPAWRPIPPRSATR